MLRVALAPKIVKVIEHLEGNSNGDCSYKSFMNVINKQFTRRYLLLNNVYFPADWLKVVRGFESLGVIFMALPLVILPVYMYVSLGLYYRSMMISMCLSSFLSGKNYPPLLSTYLYFLVITS